MASAMRSVEDAIADLSISKKRTLVIVAMKIPAHIQQLAEIFERQRPKLQSIKPGGADVLIIDDDTDESLNSSTKRVDSSTQKLTDLKESVTNFSFIQYIGANP